MTRNSSMRRSASGRRRIDHAAAKLGELGVADPLLLGTPRRPHLENVGDPEQIPGGGGRSATVPPQRW